MRGYKKLQNLLNNAEIMMKYEKFSLSLYFSLFLSLSESVGVANNPQ